MSNFKTYTLPRGSSSSSPDSSSSFLQSSSPATSESASSDVSSSDVQRLNERSRKLSRLLKDNVKKSQHRKAVFDALKDKAWILEDQVKLFMQETADLKESFARRSWKRLICFCFIILATVYLITSTPDLVRWLFRFKEYDDGSGIGMKGRFYVKPSSQFGRVR